MPVWCRQRALREGFRRLDVGDFGTPVRFDCMDLVMLSAEGQQIVEAAAANGWIDREVVDAIIADNVKAELTLS